MKHMVPTSTSGFIKPDVATNGLKYAQKKTIVDFRAGHIRTHMVPISTSVFIDRML